MKKLAFALASVIALATGTAFADEPAAPTPAPSAAPATSTPLQTRPSKALTLAPKDEGTPFYYKLLAGGVVVAAGVLYAKKKKGGLTNKKAKKKSSIDILARSSIGVRNELLVVDVEGTRLLVGMTPGSMNTLAVLQTPEGVVGEESPFMGEEKYMSAAERIDAEEEPALVKVGPRPSAKTLREQLEEDPEEEVEQLSDRVRSLLEARKKKAETAELPAPKPAPRRVAQATQPMPKARVPGQAKGLLLSMQEASHDREITKLGDW